MFENTIFRSAGFAVWFLVLKDILNLRQNRLKEGLIQ